MTNVEEMVTSDLEFFDLDKFKKGTYSYDDKLFEASKYFEKGCKNLCDINTNHRPGMKVYVNGIITERKQNENGEAEFTINNDEDHRILCIDYGKKIANWDEALKDVWLSPIGNSYAKIFGTLMRYGENPLVNAFVIEPSGDIQRDSILTMYGPNNSLFLKLRE